MSFVGKNSIKMEKQEFDRMEAEELIKAAMEAKEHAYVPYSHFRVGAALLTKSGKVYQGCNIENASYSLTVCAERTAIFKAVSEGYTRFRAIAVAGSSDDNFIKPCVPCGACLQVISEFCGNELKIILSDGEYSLSEFLPMRFDEKSMQ